MENVINKDILRRIETIAICIVLRMITNAPVPFVVMPGNTKRYMRHGHIKII